MLVATPAPSVLTDEFVYTTQTRLFDVVESGLVPRYFYARNEGLAGWTRQD